MCLSLDARHITKNVWESLLGTLLNMPKRTKDGPKARADLKSMGIREELHANDHDGDDDDDEAKQDTKVVAKAQRPRRPEMTTLPRASLQVRRRSSSFSPAS